MKARELADRIGNIDPALAEEAGLPPQRGGGAHGGLYRRLLSVAAVAALMVCSGTVGALAFSRETVVEMPAEREEVVLEEIGLTLLFPDSWKGRYAVREAPPGNWVIYSPSIKEAVAAESGPLKDEALDAYYGGVLCYIVRYDEPVTEAQFRENGWDYARYRYLFATSGETYVMYYASDVQFTWETLEEYRQMEQEIGEIQFIIGT